MTRYYFCYVRQNNSNIWLNEFSTWNPQTMIEYEVTLCGRKNIEWEIRIVYVPTDRFSQRN